MLIKIDANEIIEADIQVVSLVKRGANRAPFKIVKAEHPDNAKGSGELGVEPQPSYNRLPGATASPKPVGGPYAEHRMGPAEAAARERAKKLPVSDRHGAQAIQVASNPLNVVKDHSLDALIRHAHNRKHGGGCSPCTCHVSPND